MSPEEIRAIPVGQNSLKGIVLFLRELTAQVAEVNQNMRDIKSGKSGLISVPRQPKAIPSPARRKGGATFFVHRWGSAVQIEMLSEFVPHEGSKALADLEIAEVTTGILGTDNNSIITRKL